MPHATSDRAAEAEAQDPPVFEETTLFPLVNEVLICVRNRKPHPETPY